ncbi:MAG: hypothetical protein ABFR50_07085 [Candidatus Fermentibacteria bacterium]
MDILALGNSLLKKEEQPLLAQKDEHSSGIRKGFASILGYIMTRVLLTLVYIFAVIPTGLIMRLLRKRPLHLDFIENMKTYWVDVDPKGPCSRPEKQY